MSFSRQRSPRLGRFWMGIVGLIILLVGMHSFNQAAHSAALVVPESGLRVTAIPVTANDLKPPECASINIQNLVTGSGTITGSGINDLILGSASADTISGGNSDDCIVAGAGNDRLNGDNHNDILLGGDGDDILDGGGHTDICYGGAGTDTFISCETQYDP